MLSVAVVGVGVLVMGWGNGQVGLVPLICPNHGVILV